MQIRKTYKEVNPELLYDEVRDFVEKQGVVAGEAKLETYSVPGGSSHVVRGTLVFSILDGRGEPVTECLRAHVVGSAMSETRLMLDINEEFFPQEKVVALQGDLEFIFGLYEA